MVSSRKELTETSVANRIRRNLRRNRVLVVTLLLVGGLLAALTGISLAIPYWSPNPLLTPPEGAAAVDPRFGSAYTYDQTKSELLVFGGFIAQGDVVAVLGAPPIVNDNKLWGLRNDRWTKNSSIDNPLPRGYAAMVYDEAHKNVVLFGGGRYRTNNVYGDTWIWDGSQWTEKHPPLPLPEPRQNHAMVYDAHRRRVLMYGGRGLDGKPFQDTWVWDGSKWSILPIEGAPPARWGHAMAYDKCNAQVAMFGGLGNAGSNGVTQTQPIETWTHDGDKWTDRSTQPSPLGRVGGSMGYSPYTGRILLYGGFATNEAGVVGPAADQAVWRWDGADGTWERLEANPSVGENVLLAFAGGDGVVKSPSPPPRAYPIFQATPNVHAGARGAYFALIMGTPADTNAQYAYFDHWDFLESGTSNTDRPAVSGGIGTLHTPLTRVCENPVPLPPEDEVPVEDLEPADTAEARQGLSPVDLPRDSAKQNQECSAAGDRKREKELVPWPCVLIGTDWPRAQRNPNVGYGSTLRPNPDYTSTPACPNRINDFGDGLPNESGGNTSLYADKDRNRLYQFFTCDPDRGSTPDVQGKLLIQVHDGKTLQPLAKLVVADAVATGTLDPGVTLLHDPLRGRFYIRLGQGNQWVELDQALIEAGQNPVVQRFGTPGSNGSSMFDHPKSGRLKMLFNENNGAAVSQFDVADGSKDWSFQPTTVCSYSYEKPMRSGNNVYLPCTGVISGTNKGGIVSIPIEESPSAANNEKEAPVPAKIMAFGGPFSTTSIPMRSWGDPQTERVLILSQSRGDKLWVFDGKASRFVGVVGIATGDANQSNSQRKYGFDDQIGRFYVQMVDAQESGYSYNFKDQGGILLIDTRLTPVPQVLKFPQFVSPAAIPIVSLSSRPGVPRRIVYRQGEAKGNYQAMKKYPNGERVEFENEMFYRVLADEVPPSQLGDISNLDALTLRIPEDPGKTEAFFDAEGSGYGIRLRSIGGVHAASMPFQQAYNSLSGWESFVLNNAQVKPLVPACIYPDRELFSGWVPGARLSDLDAAASSTGLDIDSNSKVDMGGPTSRCNPTIGPSDTHPAARAVVSVLWPLWQMLQFEANQAASSGTVEAGEDVDGDTSTSLDTPAGKLETETPLGTLERGEDADGNPTAKYQAPTSTRWDSHFKQVECVGDSLKTYQSNVGNIYGSANCVQKKGLVEATARGSATGSGAVGGAVSDAGFSVGEGYSTVTVTKDPEKGVVVTSIAVARGIRTPFLSIDRVETKAVAWSNGRPSDTERASFRREICGVVTPDYSNSKCLSSGEQKQFVDNWNARWGQNSRIYLPTPDPEYYQGSPGGYIAGVIKPQAEEAEDQIFARDYQREVPGLVIEFYKDSIERGRQSQSLMLAATRAVAGFAVQCRTELVYSADAAKCVDITFGEDPVEFEEEFTDEEEFSEDFEPDAEWIPAEAIGNTGPSLGSRIGRLLDRLPVLRNLPIRQMGEALLLASVWMLLGFPLFLASRHFALSQWRTS